MCGQLLAGVLSQPPLEISRAAEMQERLGERLQLLQRQSLDAGGGGLAHGAAEKAELAQCDSSGLCRAAAGFSAGFPLRQQFLAEAGVGQMIGGEIDQGHDFLASEMGKPLTKNRKNGLK